MAKPGVTCKDLVELGFRPGPEFSEALGFAHKLQLAGVEKEEALSQAKGFKKTTLSWERVAGRRSEGGGAVQGWTGAAPLPPPGGSPLLLERVDRAQPGTGVEGTPDD